MLERHAELLKKVKQLVREVDPKARVYLFGSVVRGEATAASDIDILVVTELFARRHDMMVKVYKAVEEPVELHFATEDMLNKWYKRFIPQNELVEV